MTPPTEEIDRLGTVKVSTFEPLSPRLSLGLSVVEALGVSESDTVVAFEVDEGVILKGTAQALREGWFEGVDEPLGMWSGWLDSDPPRVYVGVAALDALGVTYGERVVVSETLAGVLLRPESAVPAEGTGAVQDGEVSS